MNTARWSKPVHFALHEALQLVENPRCTSMYRLCSTKLWPPADVAVRQNFSSELFAFKSNHALYYAINMGLIASTVNDTPHSLVLPGLGYELYSLARG